MEKNFFNTALTETKEKIRNSRWFRIGPLSGLAAIFASIFGVTVYLQDEVRYKADLEVAIAENTITIATLVSQVSALEVERDSLAGEVGKIRDEMSSLNIRNSQLQRDADAFRAVIGELRENNQTLIGQRERLSTQLSNMTERVVALEEEAIRSEFIIDSYINEIERSFNLSYSKYIDDLNSLLISLELVPWKVEISGHGNVSSYRISRKSVYGNQMQSFDLVEFDNEEIIPKQTSKCRADPGFCRDACLILDKAEADFARRELEEVRVALTSLRNDEREVDEFTYTLAELSLAKRVLDSLASRTTLYLRGVADGQLQEWTRSLPDALSSGAFEFRQLDRTSCTSSDFDCWNFGQSSVTSLSGSYGSDELPNLRAIALRRDLQPFLDSCRRRVDAQPIEILEGIDDLSLRSIEGQSFRTVFGVVYLSD